MPGSSEADAVEAQGAGLAAEFAVAADIDPAAGAEAEQAFRPDHPQGAGGGAAEVVERHPAALHQGAEEDLRDRIAGFLERDGVGWLRSSGWLRGRRREGFENEKPGDPAAERTTGNVSFHGRNLAAGVGQARGELRDWQMKVGLLRPPSWQACVTP